MVADESAPSAEGVNDTRVVRVVPALPAVRKSFDYVVPDSLRGGVRVGTEVRIVLNNRRVGGWVVEDDVVPATTATLRPLAAVRGWGPPPAVIDLAYWAAWRWAGPVSSFLQTASAPRAVRALPVMAGHVAVAPKERAGRDHEGVGALIDRVEPSGATVVRVPPAFDTGVLVHEAATRWPVGEDGSLLVLVAAHRSVHVLAQRLRGAGHVVAELPDQWAVARAGPCIAVGTRAAAFAPLWRVAGVIVLDAHDEAYVEERAPTWSAWAVVVERARRDAAPCMVVSPCPSLEILEAGPLVTLPRRAERRGWPVVEVIDRTADDPRTGLFSPRLVSVVRWAAEGPGRKVACVLNRTGRVRLLACVSCGALARCERCGGALELIDDGTPVLSCRRCHHQRPVVCDQCGATRMKWLRAGVSRVREEIAALTNAPVDEMWGPLPTSPKDAGPGVGDGGAGDGGAGDGGVNGAPVVVGTEAVLHRLGAFDAVCFLDFDAELMAPRLHAGEQALGLLARAARLVARSAFDVTPGEERARGRVLVQTRQPRHDALRSAVMADPAVLARSEYQVRRLLRLPPITALAVVSGAAADAYGSALAVAAAPGVEVSGPLDGQWSVRADDHSALCDMLASVPRPAGRLRVEVDPTRR